MRTQTKLLPIWLGILVGALCLSEPALSAAQNAASRPVSGWVGWRVFHESLVRNSQRADDRSNDLLAKQLGLTKAQTTRLTQIGEAYLAEIRSIDAFASAEARRRYGRPERPVLLKTKPQQPPKSVLEQAIDDGLYAEIEAKKQAVLTAHMQTIARELNSGAADRIAGHVQTKVSPNIKAVDIVPPGVNRAGWREESSRRIDRPAPVR
jgi:hypothetical protein